MKFPHLVLAALLASAAALPIAGVAQQAPAASPAPAMNGEHQHGNGMMMREFEKLNLSDQQKAQIQSYMTVYRQAHPQGSPRDPQAMMQLHEQIMNVLTPAQQTQFKADMAQMRQEREQQEAAPQPSPTP